MLLKDLAVVLQIAIATGCNKEKPVALCLYEEVVRMVENEKEPRDVEKSNRRKGKGLKRREKQKKINRSSQWGGRGCLAKHIAVGGIQKVKRC